MRTRQRGIALITAVLVVALATIAATAILVSANIAIRRTGNLQESELAWWYGDGVESWVKSILERDLDDNQTDSLKDAWAQPVDYLPVDEGAISGRVIDLQGLYNLNNLGTPDPDEFQLQLKVFARLLSVIGVGDEFQAQGLASAIRDWIDADNEPTGFDGAEDTEYMGIEIPYRVPNQYMASVSELLAVKGVTREIYDKLRPFVCAVPQTGVAVNVNTAPEPVLQALAAESRPELDQFIAERAQTPAESVQALYDKGVFVAQDPGAGMLGVSSAFFMSQVTLSIGSSRLTLYSFYFRPAGGIPAVYGRSTGTE
ncbi:MAG: type II secretion system minor pseudopilin GspK [Nevskiales bacterium]|nr:type II secretion system minor pseudopilin GspK [Nevskiales bacterium]